MKSSFTKCHLRLIIISLLFTNVAYGQGYKFRKIQKIINKATSTKLPGVAVYVRTTDNKAWIGVSGYANLNEKTPIKPDHIFAIGSISKTYTAVAVLKLVEQGYFKLDEKISQYLPADIISNLPNASLITIRHLLANTSGLYNYEFNPKLNELYLSGKVKLDTLSHVNALRYFVYGQTPTNLPGETYHYSSTNFMLAAMIMDKVLGGDHTKYVQENLLSENGFERSFYRKKPSKDFVNHYGDPDHDGVVEDVTLQTIETTNWFIGDDGIYAPIDEAAQFLEAVMKGKILSKESVDQLTTWNDRKHPDYGLGLMADKSFPYKFLMGHSGRGIGMTTDLFYFPKQHMTVAIFCNLGYRAAAPEFKHTYLKMRKKIVKKLFLF